VDSSLVVVFGLLMIVAVVSALIFRRRSLGTPLRAVLSLVAVALLGFRLVRDNGFSPGAVVLVLITALVLGAGILVLRRVEKETPPSE